MFMDPSTLFKMTDDAGIKSAGRRIVDGMDSPHNLRRDLPVLDAARLPTSRSHK
jgi:hypothetical protein